jgi:hypothetical protein
MYRTRLVFGRMTSYYSWVCDSLGVEEDKQQLALKNPTIEKVAIIAGVAAGVSVLAYLLYRAWKSERLCPLR